MEAQSNTPRVDEDKDIHETYIRESKDIYTGQKCSITTRKGNCSIVAISPTNLEFGISSMLVRIRSKWSITFVGILFSSSKTCIETLAIFTKEKLLLIQRLQFIVEPDRQSCFIHFLLYF